MDMDPVLSSTLHHVWEIEDIQIFHFCQFLYDSFNQPPTLTSFIQLFGQELHLDWIIFHDVLVTSRVYVRTVCPIRYEWVKDLLPKLHEIDVYELSSVAREEVTDEEMAQWEKKEAAKRQAGAFEEAEHFDVVKLCHFCNTCFSFQTETTEDVAKKLEKRNNESSITEARARYLERKQHRLQRKGTWEDQILTTDSNMKTL